jgi:hypothetical protein
LPLLATDWLIILLIKLTFFHPPANLERLLDRAFLAALPLRHPARTGVHPKDFLDPVSDNRQRVVAQFSIPDGPER